MKNIIRTINNRLYKNSYELTRFAFALLAFLIVFWLTMAFSEEVKPVQYYKLITEPALQPALR